MNVWDILLILLLAVIVAAAIRHCIRAGKRGGCGCGCDGCGAPCGREQTGRSEVKTESRDT